MCRIFLIFRWQWKWLEARRIWCISGHFTVFGCYAGCRLCVAKAEKGGRRCYRAVFSEAQGRSARFPGNQVIIRVVLKHL